MSKSSPATNPAAGTGAPKRALLLVHSYYLRDTRARRHGSALAKHGWQVDVVCARDAEEKFRDSHDDVKIWRLPTRRRGGSAVRRVFEYLTFAILSTLAITALWLRRRHRLVYVLGMPNLLVFAAAFPRILGSRVVLDMRDPFPEFFLAKFDKGSQHPIYRALLVEEKLSARFATAVLTAVPSMAELFTRSVPRGRIAVVWNSADDTLFTMRPPRADDEDRTLIYVGTVTHPYGVDLALKAVAQLQGEIPGLRLRVVGDGDLLPRLTEIATNEGIIDRLVIDAPVPLQEVPEVLKTPWLGVQPIRPSPLMEHSLSTKILEWCRVGLPVAAGRTPPLTELFNDDELLFHEAGDVDDLCARILEAHRDPESLALRAGRARKAAGAISFQQQTEAFLRAVEMR